MCRVFRQSLSFIVIPCAIAVSDARLFSWASQLTVLSTSQVNAAAETTFSAEKALDDAVAQLAAGDAGAPFRSATCVAIGPGGTGKTSARRAIQGERAIATRVSTVGGERDGLVVHLKHGDAAFATATNYGLTNVQRAFLEQLESAGLAADEHEAGALSALVTDLDAFCAVDDMRRKHAEKAAELIAVTIGAALEQSSRARETAAPKQAGTHKPQVATHKPEARVAPPPTQDSATLSTPPQIPPRVVEQIQASQDYGNVLASFEKRKGMDVREIVRVNFYDMGGQPEFWPLVGGFIRRCVVSWVNKKGGRDTQRRRQRNRETGEQRQGDRER